MAAQPAQPTLVCPLCSGQQFRREEGGLDSKWGMSQHKMFIMICQQCAFVMLFSKGRSYWMNFD